MRGSRHLSTRLETRRSLAQRPTRRGTGPPASPLPQPITSAQHHSALRSPALLQAQPPTCPDRPDRPYRHRRIAPRRTTLSLSRAVGYHAMHQAATHRAAPRRTTKPVRARAARARTSRYYPLYGAPVSARSNRKRFRSVRYVRIVSNWALIPQMFEQLIAGDKELTAPNAPVARPPPASERCSNGHGW